MHIKYLGCNLAEPKMEGIQCRYMYIQWRWSGIKIPEEEEEPLPPCFTSGPSPEYIFMLWFLLHAPLATLAFSPITDPASSFPSFTAPQLSAVCPFALSRRADGLCPFHIVFALVCHRVPQPATACHRELESATKFWVPLSSTEQLLPAAARNKQQASISN